MYKIVFFGTPSFVTSVVSSLGQNFELVAVVTAPDQNVGRKQILTSSPVKQKAQELGIKNILTPAKLKDPDFISTLLTLNPDLFIVAAYGKIIPQAILDIPKFGALNLHPSKLPKYRGASPIQAAILNGEKTTALTIIKMDQEMDHGPIVFIKEVQLLNNDTFQTVSQKMFSLATEALCKLIPDFISAKVALKVQNEKEATFTKIIKKEDGYFEIDNPPTKEVLDRMTRAYYPWPNAWTVWEVTREKRKEKKIIKFYPDGTLQMEGKKPVPLKDFLNGYPDFPLKSA